MKECKILHIVDAMAECVFSDGINLVEEYPFVSERINEYLKDGWEFRCMIPKFSPNEFSSVPPMHNDGVLIYLERER